MPKANLIPITRMREILEYYPDEGIFKWRERTNKMMRKDRVAGSTRTTRGHMILRIDGRNFSGHNLAWAYIHGEQPPKRIYHKNGDLTDNRISNLTLDKTLCNS